MRVFRATLKYSKNWHPTFDPYYYTSIFTIYSRCLQITSTISLSKESVMQFWKQKKRTANERGNGGGRSSNAVVGRTERKSCFSGNQIWPLLYDNSFFKKTEILLLLISHYGKQKKMHFFASSYLPIWFTQSAIADWFSFFFYFFF